MPTEQRRGRKIAMDKAELDAFLASERTCRLATSSPQGPHLTALWFAWDGTAMWIYSIVRSQRWTDLERDGRVAVLVDAGEEYFELRGAELRGTAEFVGAVPWTGAPDPDLAEPEKLMARKYHGGESMTNPDGRHAWLRLVPGKITSWDFRKIAGYPMRALVCRRYGPPEDLELAELPDPAPGPGDVLVEVRAAAANFADALIIANAYQVSVQPPFVPGSELAGRVLAVGADVTGLKAGDLVFGTAFHGAFAERAGLPAGQVTKMPTGADFGEAAAFGVAYRTAYHALRSVAEVTP